MTAAGISVACLWWLIPPAQWLALWFFSDLVTPSLHSQLSLATLKLLQKALLASFYSLATGHFDLLYFVVIPCRKTTSQLSAISDVSLDTEHFGISYISQGNRKSLGSGWREWGEAIPNHALPKPAQETLSLSSGCFMFAEDPWGLYLLPEFEKRAQAPLFFNLQMHLGTSISHTYFEPETRAHTSIQTPLLSFPIPLYVSFSLSSGRAPTFLSVVQNLLLNDHKFLQILQLKQESALSPLDS